MTNLPDAECQTSQAEAQPHVPVTRATGRSFATASWVLLAIAASITISVMGYGFFYPSTYTALGTWGDFVGGLLNPTLTFITFLAVLLTLWLQREELTLTRDEMVRSANALEQQSSTLEKQSFENTFFEMLRLHNSIVESIDLVSSEKGTVTKGRDAFNVFYTRLTKIYRSHEKSGSRNNREIAELAYLDF